MSLMPRVTVRLWLTVAPFCLGCAMCQGPDDIGYSAAGGRWQRTEPCYGRVGSVFTPEVGQQVHEEGQEMVGEDAELPLATPVSTPAVIFESEAPFIFGTE